jgi:hypothetical protein
VLEAEVRACGENEVKREPATKYESAIKRKLPKFRQEAGAKVFE